MLYRLDTTSVFLSKHINSVRYEPRIHDAVSTSLCAHYLEDVSGIIYISIILKDRLFLLANLPLCSGHK